MDKLVIPPNPNWFLQSICFATPDGGLIYGAMTRIVFIPSKENAASNGIKTIELKNKLCGFAIHSDWDNCKRFAVINGDLNVLIYDFEKGEAVEGHKGHETDNNKQINNQQPHTAIEFLRQNAVLSSVNSNVIRYCLLTKTFKVFLDLSMRNPITILKQSPRDDNMVAAGTKNGLILLIAVDQMEILAKLRGHDTEISSLDWMFFSIKQLPICKELDKEIDKKTSLQNLIASTDTSDIFDIYEENNDQEFGVYDASVEDRSDDEETNDAEIQEKILSNSNFNFLEACKNLKTDILADGEPEGSSKRGTYEDNKDQYGVKNEENLSIDESLQSNASSHTPVLTDESLQYIVECKKIKELANSSKEDQTSTADIPVLASGSREQVAWLWDVDERRDFCKINWHPKPKPILPSPFTNVLWIDQTTLLVTDGNGDLIEYKISFDAINRNVSCKEQKEEKFDAKGILNVCKSNVGSVLWTSSIHRRISCLDIKQDFEKIISLDTIQTRIHFILENPIDSNLIAIGGNDKRICLWNTSEVTPEKLSLRPFMNKIHSGVLCLSWHPDKDNVLAFSTREGRIGVLDVNKSANVPTVLASFSSIEVYSIAWTKTKDSVILMACNGRKFVYYSQKDQWKMHVVDHLKQGASVAANRDLLAVGNGNGDIVFAEISKNFYVLYSRNISKKYIGMMTWHENKLAVATESGVTFIKHVDSSISELIDENLLKLGGHHGRVFSVRFNKAGNFLVSCCFGGLVKVWDIESLTSISNFSMKTLAYSAIFLPSNEDIIMCGGQESTVLTYNWRQHSDETTVESKKKKKKQTVNKHINWAVPVEVVTISKNSQKRQKTKISKVIVDDTVTELSSDISKMNLQTKKATTVFNLSSRELTSNSLEFIEKLLSGSEGDERSFNESIFGDREEVKSLIEKELIHAKQLKMAQNGVVLPQLSDTLKEDIIERITNKTLTELHVAIAPSISFDLWRKSCTAYAHQLVENEDSLGAIPYFLSVNEVDPCIKQLCDGKFFREAWIVSKMRKVDSDPVFDEIMKKWLAYYDGNGNFESAAALLICKRDFKDAAEMLEKRLQKSEKLTNILDILKSKIAQI